jgi:hypothetical protein
LQFLTAGENPMKPLSIISIVACFSIVFALFSGVSFALDQNEASVSLTWSNPAPYQGSTVTVMVVFNSDSAEELTIYYVGLHFDWMDSDAFSGPDLSKDPVTISGYGSHTFGPIAIVIPENVTIGAHNYFVGIDGLQGESAGFSWDSPTQTLQIQDYETLVYNALLTQVADNITAADNGKYQSSEAQSLLQQAKNEYALALSFANAENWEEAIPALQKAFTYLEQANAEEQNYISAESQQGDLLLIVGVAAVAAVAVVAIVLVSRRKRKPPVDQPTDA